MDGCELARDETSHSLSKNTLGNLTLNLAPSVPTTNAHRRRPLLPLHKHMRRHHWHPLFLHNCQPPFVEQLNPPRPKNGVDANLLEIFSQAGLLGKSLFKLTQQETTGGVGTHIQLLIAWTRGTRKN